MAYTMIFTDDATTITVGPNLDYRLKNPGWAPKRANRRLSAMGGRSPYDDVLENPIDLIITGNSPGNVLANYTTLSTLLDQAESWGPPYKQPVSAVKFKYRKEGSEVNDPVYSAIYREPEGPPLLIVREDFTDNMNIHVTVQFTRFGGLWLGGTEEQTSGASAANPAQVTTGEFAETADIPMPIDIRLTIDRDTGTAGAHRVFALLSNESDKMILKDIVSSVVSITATGCTHTEPTVSTAYSNDVSRFTFSGSGQSVNINETEAPDGLAGRWAMFVIADNDTGSDFFLQGSIRGLHEQYITGNKILVPSGNTNPTVYQLGTMTARPPITRFQIDLDPVDATESVSGTFDLDYFAAIAIDESTRIIELTNAFESGAGVDRYVNFDHELGVELTPSVYGDNGSGTKIEWISYASGNPVVSMTGDLVSAIVFGYDEAGSWLIEDGSGGDATIDLSATRTTGYLTPP